ncbi:MAG: Rieske (2Fe-2S) protein [Bdellovibrionales bacterium]|nr:Rieske (2Fe-2S) protein [Bdellovibrionales bacterium]
MKRLTFFLLLTILVGLLGCEQSVKKRPIGWLKLGKISELMVPETFLQDKRILVRFEEGGFTAMSTECTHDLTPLKLVETPNGKEFHSEYTSSRYDARGHVLSGPSKANLPFYFLKFDSESYGGAVNTLYVEIGVEKPESWKLSLRPPA